MAVASGTCEGKNTALAIFAGLRPENYMILATTYTLNNSDTKRIQIGLRSLNEDGVFKPAIKLSGNTSNGLCIDFDTWLKFQQHVERASSYLRGATHGVPEPVAINNIVMQFTSAYGAKSIMLTYRQKTEEERIATSASDSAIGPASKKRKLYSVSVVLQKTSFDGLESVIKCINARYKQLESLASLITDCARLLITEIEQNLPKRPLDEDVIQQTLAEKQQEVEQNVRRQIKNVHFIDAYFDIVFSELTSIHLNEIIRAIILNASSSV